MNVFRFFLYFLSFVLLPAISNAQPYPASPYLLLNQPNTWGAPQTFTGGITTSTINGSPVGASTTPAVTKRSPTSTDDSTKGYAIGNVWNAPEGLFVAQQVTAGQAVWTRSYTSAFPVDAVGGAAPIAAYGTRKLTNAYSGNAINVTRASDSTNLAIGFLAGGVLDTPTLDAFCANTTCTVNTWYDPKRQQQQRHSVYCRLAAFPKPSEFDG